MQSYRTAHHNNYLGLQEIKQLKYYNTQAM